MSINSKEKGKRFERSLSRKLREYGYDTRRTEQYCGNTGEAADVVGLPYIHIEAKHVERLNIHEAMSQAKRDSEASGKNQIPAVFHKKNHSDILVTLTLEGFMEIYKEYEAGRSFGDETV